jgi:23S rRNA pseudouridine1911/1915/1917 synthase
MICCQSVPQGQKAGELLTVELAPTPQSQAFKPEMMALDVVLKMNTARDQQNLRGWLCIQPKELVRTLLNGLLARDRHASDLPAQGSCTLLDKDTSGLMVAKGAPDNGSVTMIAAREVKGREYLALSMEFGRTRTNRSKVRSDVIHVTVVMAVVLRKICASAPTRSHAFGLQRWFVPVWCSACTMVDASDQVHLWIRHPLKLQDGCGRHPAGINSGFYMLCLAHPSSYGRNHMFIKAPLGSMSSGIIQSIG